MQDDFLLDDQPKRRFRLSAPWRFGRPRWRTLGFLALLLLALLLLYYPIGMVWVHEIDDDPAFAPAEVAPEASHAIATAAALITREVDENHWTANDPFFLPGAALDNMPNFQQGIIAALSRFAVEMTDQIGRTRGSSRADADLEKAAGLLKYPGDVWIFDLSTSWAPTASSETQYRAAQRALISYNQRLAAGNAVFERRSDNLLATLDRMAADLGSASAVLDQHLAQNAGGILDFRADDIFYNIKGRLYAYGLLLRGIGVDYQSVIAERELQAAWDQMMDSFEQASTLQPLVVVNGEPDAQFVPSHLASQGFFLLRARTQLREISNILLK
ncbi:DUF2333 family protein [Rhodospirillaceae bacterium SYSU D60014]|uniref:DUF2333 family protein n=1 Tax=Virgifigura deserti TaxID=2268457 RepID=UPI000E672FFC